MPDPLLSLGYLAVRVLPDGRGLGVMPLFYGARLCLSEPGDWLTYYDAW